MSTAQLRVPPSIAPDMFNILLNSAHDEVWRWKGKPALKQVKLVAE